MNDEPMNMELVEDITNYVFSKDQSAALAMTLLVVELASGKTEEAMQTLQSYAAAMAYSYVEHREKREETMSQLFFGNKEK